MPIQYNSEPAIPFEAHLQRTGFFDYKAPRNVTVEVETVGFFWTGLPAAGLR